jgi:hypothetical protein
MSSILCSIGQHLAAHAEGYGVGLGAFVLAFAKNMPRLIPKSLQDVWDWLYGTVQTALPISRPNPIAPVANPAPNK